MSKGNTGTDNTGENNSGDGNSGDGNSGNWNSGDGNSGDGNSGDGNSGNWNSGNWNSGDGNSGNWNSGNRNSGVFCSIEPDALFFNKPTTVKLSKFIGTSEWPDFSGMNPCVWVEESIMTDEEKESNPTYKTTGGFIKKLEYKEAWAVFWRKTSESNKKKVLSLPNFSWEVFTSITGIKPDQAIDGTNDIITLNGKRYKELHD